VFWDLVGFRTHKTLEALGLVSLRALRTPDCCSGRMQHQASTVRSEGAAEAPF
jgi:hypothetical protein